MENNDITNMKILLGGSAKVALILSDVELTKFLYNADNVYRAASRAAFAITAYYTHLASKTIDVLSLQNTQRANAFRELAIELGRQADQYTNTSDAVFVFCDTDDDPNNDESIFSKNMFTIIND